MRFWSSLLWTNTTLTHSPAFRKFPDSCDIQLDVLSLSLSLCVYGQYNQSVLYAIRETAADDSNNIAIFQIQINSQRYFVGLRCLINCFKTTTFFQLEQCCNSPKTTIYCMQGCKRIQTIVPVNT